MEAWVLVPTIGILLLLAWLTFLALLCVMLDPELNRVQRWGQSVVVILVPIIGPLLILKLVNDHSPEVVSRFYIPWPFRQVILNKPTRPHGQGSNKEEIPGVHSSVITNSDSGGGAND